MAHGLETRARRLDTDVTMVRRASACDIVQISVQYMRNVAVAPGGRAWLRGFVVEEKKPLIASS